MSSLADPSELLNRVVVIFNFDFVVADPSYDRLKDFSKNFNGGKIADYNELIVNGNKEIQVTYDNKIRVRYVHDKQSNYLDTKVLYEELTILKDFSDTTD